MKSKDDPSFSAQQDRRFFIFNAIVSVAALSLLTWLLVLKSKGAVTVDLSFMPAVNAGFNACAATLLVFGLVAIKQQRPQVHRFFMSAAFVASTLFLVGYLAYHYQHGDTRYAGTGSIRTIYLVILASHILLSIPIVPMALSCFYFAWRQRFTTHKKIARITLPVWLYVSVTGVVVYGMLHLRWGA